MTAAPLPHVTGRPPMFPRGLEIPADVVERFAADVRRLGITLPARPPRTATRAGEVRAAGPAGAESVKVSVHAHERSSFATIPIAPSTRAGYRRALARFDRWRGSRPTTDTLIAEHIDSLSAQGRTVASSRITVAALRAAAHDAGEPDPSGSRTTVALRWHARSGGPGRGQAAPLTQEDARRIIASAHRPRPRGRGAESPAQAQRRGRQDVALVGLLLHCGLRAAEAAAVRARDITPAASPPGAVRVRVRASKTNDGRRPDVRIAIGKPAAALAELARNADPGDRLIGPRTGRQIARRIEAAGEAAGITDHRLTGHSGRRGLAQLLAAKGASVPVIMTAGDWRSPGPIAAYLAGLTAENLAVADFLADDDDVQPPTETGNEPQPRVLPFRTPRR